MKLRAITLIVLSGLFLTGCSALTQAESTDSVSTMTASELMFAEMMVPHHEQAVEMSDLAPSRTQNAEILALAAKIKAGQEPEILLMEAWLPEDHGHMSHDGHGMDGMLTEQELEALKDSSGPEFEKLFLEGMIQHHEGALSMLNMLEGSQNEEALALKEQIRVAQEAEIAQMKALLENY